MRLLLLIAIPLLSTATETSYLVQAPKDILREISRKVTSSKSIKDAASDIKNFAISNKYIYTIVNNKTQLQLITREMSDYFNIPQVLAAFALELPEAQQLFIELIKKASPQDRQVILRETLSLVGNDFTTTLAKKLITYYFKNNFLTDANAWQGKTLPITRVGNSFFQLGEMFESLVIWEYIPTIGRTIATDGIPPLTDLDLIEEHPIDNIYSDKNWMGNIYGLGAKGLVAFWFLEKPTSSNKTRIIFGTYHLGSKAVKSFQVEL